MAAKGILRALGEELRQRRIAMGLSQERLAEKAKLHRNFIGMIERGERNPTVMTLAALAGPLKTSVSALVTGMERRL